MLNKYKAKYASTGMI